MALTPIILRIDAEMRDPEFRKHYYDAHEEHELRLWRLRRGYLGMLLDWLSFGAHSRYVLKCPRPTAGEIDALVWKSVERSEAADALALRPLKEADRQDD